MTGKDRGNPSCIGNVMDELSVTTSYHLYVSPIFFLLFIIFRFYFIRRLPTLQPSETWNPRSFHLWKGKCSRCEHMITSHPGKYEFIPSGVAITNASYTLRACHYTLGVYSDRPAKPAITMPRG